MAYATQQDIIDRYGEDALYVAADRNNDDAVDTGVVTRALEDATEEINGYVGKKYSLPLASVPSVLVRVCVDIALYRLSFSTAYTDEKRRRYEDVLRMLRDISSGNVSLGIVEGSDSAESSDTAEVISNPRTFSRKTMGGLL